jgi:hypothetical protein
LAVWMVVGVMVDQEVVAVWTEIVAAADRER